MDSWYTDGQSAYCQRRIAETTERQLRADRRATLALRESGRDEPCDGCHRRAVYVWQGKRYCHPCAPASLRAAVAQRREANGSTR